jgi:hypothetical protein
LCRATTSGTSERRLNATKTVERLVPPAVGDGAKTHQANGRGSNTQLKQEQSHFPSSFQL